MRGEPGYFTSEVQIQGDPRSNRVYSRRHLSTLPRQTQAASSTQGAVNIPGSTHLNCWCPVGMPVAHSPAMAPRFYTIRYRDEGGVSSFGRCGGAALSHHPITCEMENIPSVIFPSVYNPSNGRKRASARAALWPSCASAAQPPTPALPGPYDKHGSWKEIGG